MFKGEKGITLIALAITIIVLLILAGISITALSNDGILGQSQKASSLYSDAKSNEESMINDFQKSLDSLASSYYGKKLTDSGN